MIQEHQINTEHLLQLADDMLKKLQNGCVPLDIAEDFRKRLQAIKNGTIAIKE